MRFGCDDQNRDGVGDLIVSKDLTEGDTIDHWQAQFGDDDRRPHAERFDERIPSVEGLGNLPATHREPIAVQLTVVGVGVDDEDTDAANDVFDRDTQSAHIDNMDLLTRREGPYELQPGHAVTPFAPRLLDQLPRPLIHGPG